MKQLICFVIVGIENYEESTSSHRDNSVSSCRWFEARFSCGPARELLQDYFPMARE